MRAYFDSSAFAKRFVEEDGSDRAEGLCAQATALGLGVMLELPMIIINIQRGGPSTGLPTKTEQSDLFQALFGRHGECPMPVISARSPADCFDVAQEAWRIATRFMVPVLLLSDEPQPAAE